MDFFSLEETFDEQKWEEQNRNWLEAGAKREDRNSLGKPESDRENKVCWY